MSEITEDLMEDIDPDLREVARTYGRSMFALVVNAGMAGQAAEVLGQVLSRNHSKHGLHALGVLGNSFNGLSNAYALSQGWTQEQLAMCERDVQRAFSVKLVTPSGAPILLDH